MLEHERDRVRGDRAVRQPDLDAARVGRQTAVPRAPERDHARAGAYAPTFDPRQVRLPWSVKARAPEPTALDLGEAKVGVVNLGTGSPRDQIQEHVNHMAFAWNAMIDNLTSAVLLTIRTIDHAAFKKAPSGLVGKLWARAECLLARAAAFVTGGSTLAATLGLSAIKKVVAAGERLEVSRIQETKDTFIRELQQNAKAVKLAGLAEGANLDVHQIISELDAEFAELGRQNPEDAWKRGDQGVVGAQAAFLKQLEQRSRDYAANVPTEDDFQREFLVTWVNVNHTERGRSALRSPLQAASYEDGYIAVELVLDRDPVTGWALRYQDSATLHCPQSREVARQLAQTRGSRRFDELGVPIHLYVRASDQAWEKLPAHWKRDRRRELRFDAGRMIENTTVTPYWQWLQQNARTSLTEIFEPVRRLQG
jgi:hypothetical protein